MFTGIISQIAKVTTLKTNHKEIVLGLTIDPKRFSEKYDDVKIGESIAVNGACLTVTTIENSSTSFTFFLSPETFEKTNLRFLKIDTEVNLERAMRLSDRLSGHLVQGHVDGLAKLIKLEKSGDETYVLDFEIPNSQLKFFVDKGSVCLNGISLTVNSITNSSISVTIIPHTWTHTALYQSKTGDYFNLEADVVAKYLYAYNTRGN